MLTVVKFKRRLKYLDRNQPVIFFELPGPSSSLPIINFMEERSSKAHPSPRITLIEIPTRREIFFAIVF